jgi:hypothetical protein
MKIQLLAVLLMLFSLLLCGCTKNPEANQNSATAQSSATANQNSTSPKNTEAEVPTSTTPPQLLLQGTYVINEVQRGTIFEMVSKENTTEITFKPPSAFKRVSKKNGEVDYTDSGQYSFIGNDKLVLKIMVSQNKVVAKPVEKQHKFTISPTGDELKLTSTKDNTAIFRRVSK